jgi:hypothetical protein
LVALCGSWWRFDIHNGSDIDLFVVVNSKEDAAKLKEQVIWRNFNGIKIGYTIIDKSSFENIEYINDAKIHYMIKNLNSLLSLILIKDNIKIPSYNKRDLVCAVKKDIKAYMDETNWALHASLDKNQLLIEFKHIHTVMKLFLLAKWYDNVEWYKQVYTSFYDLYWSQITTIIPDISLLLDKKEFDFEETKNILIKFMDETFYLYKIDLND